MTWLLAAGARARMALPESLSPGRFNALQRAFVAQGLWRGPRRPQPAPEVPV